MNRLLVSFSALLFSLAVLSAPASAQKEPPIMVGVAGMSAALIHPFIAKDSGMFQKYGVDARLVLFEGGSLLAQAAMAGEIKMSITSGPVTIASRSAGADTIAIAGYINTLPYNLVTNKTITSLEQLKGKKIAISRFGSNTDTAVRLLLEKVGLNPNKDVTIIQVGAQPTRFQALVAGTIDATIIAPPFDITAKKQGYNVLVNLAEQSLAYPQQVVETTDRFIRENPQAVKNYLKGFIGGIHYALTNKEGAKKIMAKYLRITDPEILDATYASYAQTTDRRAFPNMQGFRYAVDELARRVPAAKDKKAEDFVNMRFLNELEKEGFFKELYK
ncbi:MAG TPA: ABC transporter substrate-binding protein [Candidatus Binatia bacterium]|nr:ABC transporter substrate-binding protein [Candidatus Binatia bacterium]